MKIPIINNGEKIGEISLCEPQLAYMAEAACELQRGFILFPDEIEINGGSKKIVSFSLQHIPARRAADEL